MKGIVDSRKLTIVAICLLVSFGIDWLDWYTGEEFELFVLYFFPVGFAAWYAGRSAGLLLAVFSAITWFHSDIMSGHAISVRLESWDAFMRLASFVVVALALAQIRADLLRERNLNADLTDAMKQIKQLQGILPMCSFCRKIRDQDQNWVPLEKYIMDHSEAQVSHGLCPSCYRRHYGQVDGT